MSRRGEVRSYDGQPVAWIDAAWAALVTGEPREAPHFVTADSGYSSNTINAAQSDINQWSTALNQVSEQRVARDNSLNRLTAAAAGFA